MSNLVLQDFQNEDTYLLMGIGDILYAIDSESVLEIIKLVELDFPERLPRHIAGIIEYNSVIINIVDLRSLLNMPLKPYTIDSQILIIATDEMIFGLIVDEVIDIKKINRSFLHTAPYHSEHTFAKSIYTEGSQKITCLSLRAIEKAIKEALEDVSATSDLTGLMPQDINSHMLLKERSTRLSKKTDATTAYNLLKEKDQYITFFVGTTRYCMKIEHIKGFFKINHEKITRVPCVPKFITGLLNIKGDCIALIDLKSYFNEGEGVIAEKSIIIMPDAGEFKIGFVTDRVGESVHIPEEELAEYAQDSKGELIDYVCNDELYHILNIPQLLNNEKLYIR